MEPDGQPVSPGTSYGPPAFSSAQDPITPTLLSCSLESSCSPNSRDGLMSAKCTWDPAGEEDSEQSEDSAADLSAGCRENTRRRFRSSAFPSSLSWDSDSEKETVDEEELQRFSNPHGLASHSPGSPSAGLRLDSEDDQEDERVHHFHSKTDTTTSEEGRSENESTKTEEPSTSQLSQKKLAEGRLWNVSESAEPFLSKVKPKKGCQMEEEARNSEGETRPKGKESKEPERDVYTFPGDSDPESPPPAPWAHCTFIQRCRKKRVLLRPFSGLGISRCTLSETDKLATLSPQKSKTNEMAQQNPGREVYDYEEISFEEGAVETKTFGGKAENRDIKMEGEMESGTEIFTCVECSIYFKKQVHLQEHMIEHCQSGVGGGRRSGKGSRLQCIECGWNLPNRHSLADHRRKHQESRLKILEEIEKLNENEKPKDLQTLDCRAVKNLCADATVAQLTDPFANPGEKSNSEIVTSTASAVTELPLNSARTPTQARTVSSYRRRFVCTECNFSTKTSQALANHSKTHNRKKHSHGSPLNMASSSLACGHCAFLTTSQTALREHQTLVHPRQASDTGEQDNETDHIAHISKIPPDSHYTSESSSLNEAAQGTSEDRTTPDGAAARLGFKCHESKRFSTRGKPGADLSTFDPELDHDSLLGNQEEDDHSSDLNLSQQDANSPAGGHQHTRVQLSTDDASQWHNAVSLAPTKQRAKDKDKEEEEDGKVFFLRRSSRISAAAIQTDRDDDDDDDDVDKDCALRFLSEDLLDEIDDDIEELKSVERKCPYCPDRFHNGIGLANHVRGHLNRVGVSYNVRHFISPEEVNEIEKKFSYQKKKKKVANFDPDTFSVMHCEFCSAGFDTRAGLSSHARAHLRDFGITNWDITISPIHILRELFSRRPDLVIPTDPPRSLCSSPEVEEDLDDDHEKDSEEEGTMEVKLEGEPSVRSRSTSGVLPSARLKRKKAADCKGEDEEAAEEEDEEDLQLSALDHLSSSPGKTDSIPPLEDANTKVKSLKCEVCNSQFGSKRGLSIHARAHLRQLGITVSESSGPSVEILYRIAKERSIDGKVNPLFLKHVTKKTPSLSVPLKDEQLEDVEEKPLPFSTLAKAGKAGRLSSSSPTPTPSPGASPVPSHSVSPSSVVKKAPISSLLPVSSPLRSPEHKTGAIKSLTSNLSAASTIPTAKPLWAPQESDAPLNLTLEAESDKDIVCQLCGAWFETRKGLSSHARAHLRHFGVEYSESKGSPISLLNQFMDTDDFTHKASELELDSPTEPPGTTSTLSSSKQSLLTLSSTSSSSLQYKVTTAGGGSTSKATSSTASSLPGPPAKRLKASSMQVFRLSSGELMAVSHNDPPKEIGCEYCGEYFENRKGLSSHARSHLRQMGITEWSVNGSPIDTLREVITRRGLPCALPLKPLKSPPPTSPAPPRSPLSASSSPSSTILSRLPFAFARPSSPPQSAASKSSSAPLTSLSGLTLKPKPEPMQLEVTTPGVVGRSGGFPAESLNSNWSSSDNVFPLNLAVTHEVEPTRDIRCEFCGEYFENRKGLSSHARSHLRQMGITEWSVNGSPIDTLREVIKKRGAGGSSNSNQVVKKESSQGTNSPLWENMGGSSSLEGLGVSGYQSSKFRKSPLSLVQSGSRFQKQGLGSAGPSSPQPAGKFFRVSPLGKRPLSEETQSGGTAQSHRLKTFSSLPHDFSLKRKPSPDKHAHQDPSCELCGFYFENRKALASHARAHLRQFGVTEWSVNGSPIETLSAWMRSRPQKVLEMHRSYMQGNRSTLKKKVLSSSSSSSQWSSSLAASLVRPRSHDVGQGSSEIAEDKSGSRLQEAPVRSARSSPSFSRLSGSLPLQAQVARSELNVRLPRGFERRPLKHPACPDGPERDSGTPKPPRTGTVPALLPKPPSYPLVKLVGKLYTLKCRFCEVEFHGPLSVQEDWIRHLQQHILKMNYNKPAAPKAATTESCTPPDPAQVQPPAPASTPTSRTATTPTRSTAPSSPSPSPPTQCAPAITATDIVQISEEQPTIIPTPIPLPTQLV